MPHHNVVVFAPHGNDHLGWLAQCANYCVVRRYEIVSVASEWADVLKFLMDGRADIAVTPRRDLIPPDAVPRIEAIDDDPPSEDPKDRRPHRK